MSKTKYAKLVSNFSSQLERRGIKSTRLHNDLRHPFDELSEEEIQQNLEFIQSMIDQYEVLDPNQSKRESSRSIVLHKGMVPIDSSIFEKIEEDDFVEIVDLTSLAATYRCVETFKITNYTVEELLSYSSLVLFDRPSWVITRILEILKDVQEQPRLYDISFLPTYNLQETLSLTGDRYLISHKFVCPLMKMGETKPCAVLSTFRFQKCDPNDSSDIRII